MHGQQNVKMKTNISRSGLLRMRNLTDKSCRENQNTQFMLIIPFPKKNLTVYEKICKNMVQPERLQI